MMLKHLGSFAIIVLILIFRIELQIPLRPEPNLPGRGYLFLRLDLIRSRQNKLRIGIRIGMFPFDQLDCLFNIIVTIHNQVHDNDLR